MIVPGTERNGETLAELWRVANMNGAQVDHDELLNDRNKLLDMVEQMCPMNMKY